MSQIRIGTAAASTNPNHVTAGERFGTSWLIDGACCRSSSLPTKNATDLTSSSLAVDVAENWQSEFLQFTLYILATVYLVQRGSSESKELNKAGLESDAEQKVAEPAMPSSPAWAKRRGWRLAVHSRSLTLVMALIFVGSWVAQLIAGRAAYNEEQLGQLEHTVSWVGYASSADFWSRTAEYVLAALGCASAMR